MAKARLNRGQASPISIMILIAATLALALAIYAYFQARVVMIQDEQLLLREVASTASMIDYSVVSWSIDNATVPVIACYTVNLVNVGDITKKFWITVLPLDRNPSGYYMPNIGISIIPVDQDTTTEGLNLYFYYFNDTDDDGILEVIGNGGVILFETSPSCNVLRGNATAYTSSLPINLVAPSYVRLSPDSPPLSESAQIATGAPLARDIPLLAVTLDPQETVVLFFFVEARDHDAVIPPYIPLPNNMYLAVFTEYNGIFYMAIAFELPTG